MRGDTATAYVGLRGDTDCIIFFIFFLLQTLKLALQLWRKKEQHQKKVLSLLASIVHKSSVYLLTKQRQHQKKQEVEAAGLPSNIGQGGGRGERKRERHTHAQSERE